MKVVFVFSLFCTILIPFATNAEPLKKLQALEGERFIVDLRYNTDDNFLKTNVYKAFQLDHCYVHPDLYAVLQKLEPKLKEKGVKLVFWDCFRPLKVQQAMWKIVPDSRYVANPKVGSNHNRGVAVDVTLAKEDGTPLPMPTPFDDFTAKASPNYTCKSEEKEKCENRDLLKKLMTESGLTILNSEWWHFQLPHAGKYPIVEDLNSK
jgi:D-alanyl-D-alanine dipeptidase